jgi:ribonuclease HI
MYLTFGKYRNHTVKEVVNKDKQYSQWLMTQPWFNIKHKELYRELYHELNNDVDKKPVIFNKKSFIAYTDGACKNNGSKKAKAGIGIHFSEMNKIKINDISERLIYKTQTNNAAELTAILKCLEKCLEYNVNKKIYIYTDSDYSMKCITLWYPEWIKKGNYEDRKNIDILHKINSIYKRLDVEFIHIRAHTGLNDIHSKGNEMADRLAVESIS